MKPRKAGARSESEVEAGHDVRVMLSGSCQKNSTTGFCTGPSIVRCYTVGCRDHGLKLCAHHHIEHDQFVIAQKVGAGLMGNFADLFEKRLDTFGAEDPLSVAKTVAICSDFGDAARLLLETLKLEESDV